MPTYTAALVAAVFLDTGVLSQATQRRGKSTEGDACRVWVQGLLAAKVVVFVPEICDYELRREFLRQSNTNGIARLDAFVTSGIARYLSVNTSSLREAARLWAEVRKAGKPTAPDNALDGDCIVCGQVNEWCNRSGIALADVVVATTNVSDLARFSDQAGNSLQCAEWRDITL